MTWPVMIESSGRRHTWVVGDFVIWNSVVIRFNVSAMLANSKGGPRCLNLPH